MCLDCVGAFWSRWETFTWSKLYWNRKCLHLLFWTTIHSCTASRGRADSKYISISAAVLTQPTSCMQRCQQSTLFPLGTGCCRLLSHLHHLKIVHRDEGQFPVGQIHRTCSSWTLLSPQCSPVPHEAAGSRAEGEAVGMLWGSVEGCGLWVSRIHIKTAWWYDQRDLNTEKGKICRLHCPKWDYSRGKSGGLTLRKASWNSHATQLNP